MYKYVVGITAVRVGHADSRCQVFVTVQCWQRLEARIWLTALPEYRNRHGLQIPNDKDGLS